MAETITVTAHDAEGHRLNGDGRQVVACTGSGIEPMSRHTRAAQRKSAQRRRLAGRE